MNVILFYQHISRELYSMYALEDELSKRGYNTYILSIDFELDNAYKLAKKNKVDIIITPWMYHISNYEDFVPFIKYNNEVVIINLHQEQIAAPFSIDVIMPEKGVASDSVYHFCWGEYFKEKLIERGISENLIKVTGSIRNDEIFNVKYNKNILAKKYGLDEKKDWIIFAENRNFIMKPSSSRHSDYLCKGITENDLQRRIDYYKKALNETINDLNTLPDYFFEKYEVIYRAHPGFQGNMGIKNNKIHEISEISIYEWLSVVRACLVYSSTTAFEADMFNVPVYICSKEPINSLYLNYGLDEYIRIGSVLDIAVRDFDEDLDSQSKKKNYVKYYGEVDGHSVNRVVEAIEQIIKDENATHPKMIRRNTHWKSFVAMKLTRLIVALNLLDVVKFPRSAYQHKNDIPYYKNNMKK